MTWGWPIILNTRPARRAVTRITTSWRRRWPRSITARIYQTVADDVGNVVWRVTAAEPVVVRCAGTESRVQGLRY
jgi:hypothetical protein